MPPVDTQATTTSTLFPKLHPENLKQLKSAIRFRPKSGVYIHGDGNMYFSKKMSDDRMIFHNDHADNYGAGFRAFFDESSTVPADLKGLEDVLVKSTNDEKKAETVATTANRSSNPNAMPREDVAAPAPAAAAPAAPAAPAKPADGNGGKKDKTDAGAAQ